MEYGENPVINPLDSPVEYIDDEIDDTSYIESALSAIESLHRNRDHMEGEPSIESHLFVLAALWSEIAGEDDAALSQTLPFAPLEFWHLRAAARSEVAFYQRLREPSFAPLYQRFIEWLKASDNEGWDGDLYGGAVARFVSITSTRFDFLR